MTDSVSTAHWIIKAMIAGVGLGLFPLLIGALEHRGVRNEVTMAWWLLGTGIGFFALSKLGGGGIMSVDISEFFARRWDLIVIAILGASFGLVMNVFYAQAIMGAPSPAIAIAILEAAVILTYIATPVVQIVLPGSFPNATINWAGLMGAVITTVGLVVLWKSH